MRVLLPLLLLPSFALGADSFECQVRRGSEGFERKAEFSDGVAQVGVASDNALGLGLDASLSRQSFFVVLEDARALTRVAFTASPKGVSERASVLESGHTGASCVKREASPSKEMPSRPELPGYLVCVLDELSYVNGSVAGTKRLARKVLSTALSRLPMQLGAAGGGVSFRVRLNLADFREGLRVELRDDSSGRDARFRGPAATFQGSFLLGLTQGRREHTARFHRLGCLLSPDPAALP